MTPSSTRLRILVLEDNPLDVELAKAYLETAPLDFDLTVVDCRERFEFEFYTHPYDLILADYSLPDFDGLSALAIVRSKYLRLPFIFVSGVLGEDVAVETMRKGATDYVLKQRLERLVPAVERALSEHQDYLLREKAEVKLKAAQDESEYNRQRRTFLLELLQSQRSIDSPDLLMSQAAQRLGDFLRVGWSGFYELVNLDQAALVNSWSAEGLVRIEGNFNLAAFGTEPLESYRQGVALGVSDVALDKRVDTSLMKRKDVAAYINMPIVRGSSWNAGFYVASVSPRTWSEEEISLIREVADITWDSVERARAVQKVADSELRLRTAAETAQLGSWELSLQTGKMDCSDLCKANFGRPLDQEFTYAELRASIHPDDADAMADAVQRAIDGRAMYRHEYRIYWPDGSLHWVVVAGRAQYEDDGTPFRMTGFSLDVTERHLAQVALLESEKLAVVGRLASSIAHEINNPLESVTNLLYLASVSSEIKETKGYVDLAEQELRRVTVIANQTLRFHRQATRPRPCSEEELFESVLSVYQGRLVNSHISVAKRFAANSSFECFDGEMRQVLSNLVANAIDAMRNGGCLALRSREAVSSAGIKGIVLTVADTGSGIPFGIRSKIFDAFFTTKGINGTGLGLWITHEIIKRHHGNIAVRSSQRAGHSGTVINIFLPCLQNS